MPTCVRVLILDPVALKLLIQVLLFLQYERILLDWCTPKALLDRGTFLEASYLFKRIRRGLELLLSASLQNRSHAKGFSSFGIVLQWPAQA